MKHCILAIDPGPTQSAWVWLKDGQPEAYGISENDALLGIIGVTKRKWGVTKIVTEMIASYGMPVGAEVFETCAWIGQFEGAAARETLQVQRLYRKEIVTHLCHNPRAKDSNVRQALIDRFGPGKEKAVGTKKSPGPLYGVKKDVWSALAVAITAFDKDQWDDS